MTHHDTEKQHITDYWVYGVILVILLFCTFISVDVVHYELKAWTVAIALGIACLKGTLVLAYFMHLKFDNVLFKILVAAVLMLFLSFILLTFVDYLYR